MAYDTNLFRLPDPTTSPAGPGFVAVGLTNNVQGTISNLNTGGSISVESGGSFWTFSINYPELTIEEGDTIFPILTYLANGFKTIYVQLPQYINPKTGAWSTSTSALIAEGEINVIDSNTIEIPLWSTRGGDLSAGDMLKFTNSNKIYKIAFTSLNADTKRIVLSSSIIDTNLMPTAGLEPNNIKFRVRIQQEAIQEQLTSRGVYEAFTVNFKENIL